MNNLLESFGKDGKKRVENAVEKLQQGFGILLVDDENRENEGDLIFSAAKITEKDMALMIRECSGIVCLCLSAEKCKSLGLTQMVDKNTSKNQTAFTISIEAKDGVTTGVSAKDRVTTIKKAISDKAKPEDLSHPGHVFPLLAQKDGVFKRRGHTEGSVDLMKIAGLGEFAILCELTNEDGTMSRLPEISDFAKKHNMTVVSIEDICQYREITEKKEIFEAID
nr:3,4-dihydroxy-2-butanone-4-phosphate synthase [uncultured Draconibacterium sp.]